MTFTYSVASLTTDLAKVRLEVGDTDSTKALFQDEEINVYLANRANSILLTAADLCDVLASRFASEYDFATDGQSFKRGFRSGMYAARAKALRVRASGGLSTITTTKVDGYSEDLSSRDGAGQADRTGRVRRGYYDGDELPH